MLQITQRGIAQRRLLGELTGMQLKGCNPTGSAALDHLWGPGCAAAHRAKLRIGVCAKHRLNPPSSANQRHGLVV